MADFKKFSIHSTESDGRAGFEALRAERVSLPSFSGALVDPVKLDPETSARKIVEQALESSSLPSFTAPEVKGKKTELKSLGVETLPLTGTRIVKFRQMFDKIPVYSSLITVELDENNECIAINSALAEPENLNTVAKVSPENALKVVAAAAGYGESLPNSPPRLNIYLDQKGKWRLVYIVEDVPIKPGKESLDVAKAEQANHGEMDQTPSSHHHSDPNVFDYIVDAITGSLIAQLPRTPGVGETVNVFDELGTSRMIEVDRTATGLNLVDSTLGIETYDFGFNDPKSRNDPLPGKLISNPPVFSLAAVSAHANASVVSRFLRQTLMRNNIDNKGGRLVSSINCVIASEVNPPGSKQWFNAFWTPVLRQMVYGQVFFQGTLRTLAAGLDVVAHEMFHGVTNDTSKLEYVGMSGALNESYSDIFGIIVSNFENPSIDHWNWLLGEGLSDSREAFRDFANPARLGQPDHMRNFVKFTNFSQANDYGGVHANSGIHNFAAFKIMTSKAQNGDFLFNAQELARIFYICLTQYLTRQSTFSDSRHGVLLATRTMFRTLATDDLNARVQAIEAGFEAAGIP
jgi:Zn-dependent metalloprotease